MAKHIKTGAYGEKVAFQYLLDKGYSIVAQNWRWGKGEIDIIAIFQDVLVFVEVKTRSKSVFGHPEESVSQKKQQLMFELASEYMYRQEFEGEYRFDIIAIVLQPKIQLQHYKDAFFPTW